MGWWLVLPWTTAFRPQLFTYLGCAVVIGLVDSVDLGGRTIFSGREPHTT